MSDENVEKGPEPESDANAEAPTASADPSAIPEETTKPEAEKRSLGDRIRDVEARWKKDFDDVLLDLHDHVFGTSPPLDHDAEKKVG